MTSRERVLTSLAFEQPDRVPVDYKVRRDVTGRLAAHVGVDGEDELLRFLGIDFRAVSVSEHHPVFEARTNGVLGGSMEKKGRRFVFHPDGAYEDAWGIVFRPGADGVYEQWVQGPFLDNDDLESFAWPGHESLDPVETVAARVREDGGGLATITSVNYPFKICWQMRGLESFMCDTLLEPDFARALWKRVAGYEQEKAVRAAKAGVDVVAFVGDIAMQNRLMLSVPAWRAIDKPLFAGMIAAVKKANPSTRIMYHSDGNLLEVIDDLIEVGVEILNPIQPESMDPADLKRRYGRRLVLNGAVSIQRTLPFGGVADVRAEIGELIRDCAQGGGFILAPSNHILADVPFENILEMYRAAGSLTR
jgi:uroporphyrinogen decarboxylase